MLVTNNSPLIYRPEPDHSQKTSESDSEEVPKNYIQPSLRRTQEDNPKSAHIKYYVRKEGK